MLTFTDSRDPATISIKIEGTMRKEDMSLLEEQVMKNFSGNTKFNLLAIFDDVTGSEVTAFLKGMKFDITHWNQYNRIAILSDNKWIKHSIKVTDYLPGVHAEHFDKEQLDQAWEWIKQ